MKRKLNKLIRVEKGQALMLVMVLLLLAGLIIAPLLAYVGTGLKVGREVYEERMYEQYAADAGVQDAIHRIRVGDASLPGEWDGVWTDEDYDGDPHEYYIPPLNDSDEIKVTIKPYWALTTLEDDSHGKTPHDELVTVGDTIGAIDSDGDGIDDTGLYQISISFNGTGQLKIVRIGAWLPAGYSYMSGSSNLGSDPQDADFRGGKTLIWEYGTPGINFDLLPGGSEGKAIVTFQFTPLGNPLSAFSWVRTNRSDIYLSWDADVKIYQIDSMATGGVADKSVTVTVRAFATKNEPRKLGSGMSGDYVATGSSLMLADPNNDPWDPGQDWRSQLLKESSATIQNGDSSGAGYIPANANVEAAYLYWSGFIDYHYLRKSGGGWGGSWRWVPNPNTETPCNPNEHRGVHELNYNNYSGDPSQLVVNAKVNTVSFGGGVTQDITADQWEVAWKCNDSPACWYYNCFKDVTNLQLSDGQSVKQHIEGAIGTGGSGTYTFTLGHASHDQTVLDQLRLGYPGVPGGSDNVDYYSFDLYNSDGTLAGYYTGYPLGTPATKSPTDYWGYHGRYHASYAGWSLIVIYSSPETEGHQLYLYDIQNPNFMFVESFPGGAYGSNPDFDGDGNPGGKISGFLVPPQIAGEVNAAHMTCFVGEGDDGKTGDSFKVTGPSGNWAYLPDGMGGALDDVWNSKSVGITAPGVDIDTFYVTWGSHILESGDTWAQVDINTVGDGFTLIYIIISFRSETKTGGTLNYVYVGG